VTPGLDLWFIFLILVALAGLVWTHYQHQQPLGEQDRSGWLYFIAAAAGPVKVGMSSHEPTAQRLPELQTMSPIPLKLLFKMYVHDRWEAEQRAHDALSEYRTHGEWFERDAALSYMDHLKGAW
jgi:hypothetical protein